ncbi:MAG: S41 family peptidase [Rhodanobacter sp.]
MTIVSLKHLGMMGAVACLLTLRPTLAASVAPSVIMPTPWAMSVGKADYSLNAHGSVLDIEGAHVELTSSKDRKSVFGGSISSVDATHYRGHIVGLSGLISTAAASDGSGIWIRADSTLGKLTFANSQASLVKGTSSSQKREIQIVVPNSATVLVFGTFLEGDGHSQVDHLSLMLGDAVPHDSIVPAHTELDAAIKIIRGNALHASLIDWNVEPSKLHAQIGKDDWSQDTYSLIRELLTSLQDHHSRLLSPTEADATRSATAAISAPNVEQRSGGVGYIALPGFNNSERHNVDAYEESALTGISRIAVDVRTGWIIDLRNDTGGNVWPMLVALGPFLGDGPLGYFKGSFGISEPWKVHAENGHLKAPVDFSTVPLAVLIGPRTVSAGEAVVIALHGRPHTRFFGTPTAGVPTGNRIFTLPDGAEIALTTSVELDRFQKEYDGPLQPDVVVARQLPSTANTDNELAAAQKWLLNAAR